MSKDSRTSMTRLSREDTEVILQDEFSMANGHQTTVAVKLTAEALTWKTTTTKRGFALKRLFSDSSSQPYLDDLATATSSGDASSPQALKTSRSFPNGFHSEEVATHRLNISDMVGCDLAKGDMAQEQACYLRIYAYPVFKNFLWKYSVRKRGEVVFAFSRFPGFAQNQEVLEKWQREIKRCIRRQSSLEVDSQEPVEAAKKLLVLINPFSGPGKALHIFQSRIIPILAEAGIPYEAVVTKHHGHAREVARDLDLKSWGGIAIVSGDGLIYEVINGFMERPDAEEAIKTPIAALPGGSGNALTTSILYQAGEAVKHNMITSSALLLAKNRVRPMDLVALDTCTGRRLYSFLSVTWGIVSDIDIESERYRNLGKARFTVGAVSRILNLRKYSGKLHFLPINPAYKCKWSSYDRTSCQIFTGDNREPAESSPKAPTSPRSDEGQDSPSPSSSSSSSSSRHPTSLLAPLNEPVPNNWVTMEASDIVSVVAIYQTHLGEDFLAFPHSRLKDGCIYLTVIRGNVSRYKVLQFFNAMQTGTLEITDDDHCEVVKVAAFRLEPGDNRGIIAVDGEVVDCGPIQGQVLEGLARVYT